MSKRFKPFLTIALIIEYDQKFLVVEEKDEYDKLVFGFPAGHVDAKESIQEAAVREGLEETGREIELLSLVGVYDYVKESETILRFLFKAKLKDESNLDKLLAHDPDGDILSIKWMSKDEIYSAKDSWRTRLVGHNLNDYLKGQSFPLNLIDTVRS